MYHGVSVAHSILTLTCERLLAKVMVCPHTRSQSQMSNGSNRRVQTNGFKIGELLFVSSVSNVSVVLIVSGASKVIHVSVVTCFFNCLKKYETSETKSSSLDMYTNKRTDRNYVINNDMLVQDDTT